MNWTSRAMVGSDAPLKVLNSGSYLLWYMRRRTVKSKRISVVEKHGMWVHVGITWWPLTTLSREANCLR